MAINWRKKDYLSLGKAISDFNRKINKLNALDDNMSYLPDTLSYKIEKEKLQTREDLNRYIKSLRRFLKQGAEEKIVLESGQEITKWERQNIAIARRIITRNLNTREKYLRGLRGTDPREFENIESERRAIYRTHLFKDESYKRHYEYLMKHASTIYIRNREQVYRDNFYTAIEGFSNFDNFEKFKRKLDSITNNKEFYEYVNNSMVFRDVFEWYRGNIITGAFASKEEEFDYGLYELGLINNY